MSPSPHAQIATLTALRREFSAAAAAQKRAALSALRILPRSLRALRTLHDLLLFMRAHPDDAGVLAAVESVLAALVEGLRRGSKRRRAALPNSGIAGTDVRPDCGYDVARALARAHPGAVEVDWDEYEHPERLDPVLHLFLAHPEIQTFDDGALSTREWVRLARGDRAPTDLAWLLHQLDAFVPRAAERRRLFESAGVPVVWRLDASGGSRTELRCACGPVEFQSAPLRRETAPAARTIMRPLRGIRRLSPAVGARLIQAANEALAARQREVYAFARGNPAETYLAPLGRGAHALIAGVLPDARLPLEANYGYMIFKNGVPVGYGGASPLFSQTNTGVNIFAEQRGGESAFLFTGVLRAFRSLFGTTRFIANPYQFGAGNSEALRSGAFWFYHALGFRPAAPAVARIARREAQRRERDRAHRSDAATLRALAGADLHLALADARRAELFDEAWLGVLAEAVTRRLTADARPRKAALRAMVARVRRRLKVRGAARWPASERRAFERLAPLLDLVEGLERWPAARRRALVELLRAKGRPQERDYARRLAPAGALRDALAAFCRSAPAASIGTGAD